MPSILHRAPINDPNDTDSNWHADSTGLGSADATTEQYSRSNRHNNRNERTAGSNTVGWDFMTVSVDDTCWTTHTTAATSPAVDGDMDPTGRPTKAVQATTPQWII